MNQSTDPRGNLAYHPNADSGTATLVRDPVQLSLRFNRVKVPMSEEAEHLLRDRLEPVAHLSRYRLAVYRGGDSEARESAVDLLNKEDAVEFCSPVLHRAAPDKGRTGADNIYVTRNFVVQFWPEVSRERIDALNDQHNVKVVEQQTYAANTFVLAAPAEIDGLGAITAANIYWETGLVRFAHPDLITRKERRATAVLPEAATKPPAARDTSYLPRQWHLDKARVKDAWHLTQGDPDICVAVLDDGLDTAHPEFAANLRAQYDFDRGTADARPKSSTDKHGTACCGVAVAEGKRAFGVAPKCGLLAARFPDALGDADEAAMFQWAADSGADVISCSWGPPDGTGMLDPLPGSTQAAIAYCLSNGRGGKGAPVCFAAGNGEESVDLDGYAANPDVIAVAASTDEDEHAWYSDYGDAIWVCAPSSGGTQKIITTDRLGAAGYNSGTQSVDDDYTDSFGGTSSAAPLVAGVIALMLSANPALTASQVRTILKNTARRIGDDHDASGHSPKFGYGLVDAYAAVDAAQKASTTPQPTPAHRPPTISGPVEADRAGPGPAFELDPGTGSAMYYAVEVATAAELFDAEHHSADRTDGTFYATWQDSPLLAANPYRLPDRIWRRLDAAEQLFYRAWFSSSADSWSNVVATTEDADALLAPSLAITDRTRLRGEPAKKHTTKSETPTHAGMDNRTYLGDDVMQDLYLRTNLAWTGFYLAPAPSQGYTGWMSKAAYLRELGWGLAPIFVGQQAPGGPGSHILTAEQGHKDATKAVALADQAGIGTNAVIYLDIEIGGTLAQDLHTYVQTWIDDIRASGSYRPGVYCSYSQTAAQLRADNPDVYFWVFRLGVIPKTQPLDAEGNIKTPFIEGCGIDYATMWQYIQGASGVRVPHEDGTSSPLNVGIDLDCATVLDPSFPEADGGGSDNPPVSVDASITGPTEADRSSAAPMFDVNPGSGPAMYYAVEVATSAELFDWANHESEHTTDNHYASWDDTGFLASNPYQLPDKAWQRLNAADALYYRAWFSSSDTDWVDQVVTTADDNYGNAPYVTITGTAPDNDWWSDTRRTRDETVERRNAAQPVIIGPDSADKDGPAPTFGIELPDGACSYRAEFATEASLFDAARMRQRLPNNFFGSPVTDAKGSFDYTLPDDAWDVLKEDSSHLYYRVHSAPVDSSASDWHPQASSTPDAMAEQAPWVMVYTVE